MSVTAEQLAEQIGARIQGDGQRPIEGCATLEAAGGGEVTFLANPRYVNQLRKTAAGAVILSAAHAELAEGDRTLLISDDPYYAFRNAMVALHGFRPSPTGGVSDQAQIEPTARLGEGCAVNAFTVIAAEAQLGERCAIYPGCYIGAGARLGDDCVLHPGVTIYENCVLGDRVTLHAGCSIGQDGFGYATHRGAHYKIPQAGNAVVENDVEMGANCVIDRATLGSTVIGAGTKFSNSVTIGHGTRIGRGNLFVAQVGVAGSVTTGDYVVLGGQTGVAGHLHIGDGAQVAGQSGVTQSVPAGVTYGGLPAGPLKQRMRLWNHLQRLPERLKALKDLEKRVGRLERGDGS